MVRCSEPKERCFIDAYLRKLPPTLHKRNRLPIPSCSKAPRGLFVQQRVPGIFTGSSISPSPWLRECSDRYAFRAGRNLPDKGLRYHRHSRYHFKLKKFKGPLCRHRDRTISFHIAADLTFSL
jgi:hypothetical protein